MVIRNKFGMNYTKDHLTHKYSQNRNLSGRHICLRDKSGRQKYTLPHNVNLI